MHQWHLNPVGGYVLVALLALALFGLLTLRGSSFLNLAASRRLVLTGLRGAVILLAIFALLRPTLVYTEVKKQQATLLMLFDQSRSMTVPDAFGGKSRWEALKSVMADSESAVKALSRDIEVRPYTFDADLHALDVRDGKIPLPDTAAGKQTAIGFALDGVLRRETGKRLAGVILLSDGAQRSYAPRDLPPQTPARRLAELGCPLYSIAFGNAGGLNQTRDVAIKDLQVNQTVFVKNELVVSATVQMSGFVNQPVPVQLLFEGPPGKMQVVGSARVTAQRDGQSVPVTIGYVPEVPGEYKVSVRVQKQSGEVLTTNNQMSSFVTVLKGGVNVLYLEGALRVEQKFIRQSLDASPDIQVDYFRIDARDRRTRPEDLLARFAPGRYDVYILGDLDASAFTRSQLEALAIAVERGAGLIMLGGQHSFGPGAYAETSLARVLPIEMDALEQQPFGEAIRQDVHLPGPLPIQPTPTLGQKHYLMGLGPLDRNEQIWQGLPPLEGANKFASLKSSARVLAETPQGAPLLVAQDAGGRVLAFAGDSTWHWVLAGKGAQHKRFWRQVILWLAHQEDKQEGNIWIKLAQRRYSPGGRVEFTAGMQDERGGAPADAPLKAEIVLPGGERQSLPLVREQGGVRGSFVRTDVAGDYVIEVGAADKKHDDARARARFVVEERDLELDNAAADPTSLAGISKITQQAGGQSLAPEELPELLRKIKNAPLDLEVQTQTKSTPWDTWPFLLAFVGLLSTEWALRKRWGLV